MFLLNGVGSHAFDFEAASRLSNIEIDSRFQSIERDWKGVASNLFTYDLLCILIETAVCRREKWESLDIVPVEIVKKDMMGLWPDSLVG